MRKAIIIGFLLLITVFANAQVFFGVGLSKYHTCYRDIQHIVNQSYSIVYYEHYEHKEYYVFIDEYFDDTPYRIGAFSSTFGYQHKRFTYGFAIDHNQLQWKLWGDNINQSTISICPFFSYDLIQKDKLNFFLEASCCFANSKVKQNDLTSAREGGVCFGLQPGFRYHFNSHWSMVAYWGMIAYSGNGNIYNFDGLNFTFDTKSVSFDVYFNF